MLIRVTIILVCGFIFFIGPIQNVKGQSTYQKVYSIFQTSCAPTCHTSSSPNGQLDLTQSQSVLYNQLINGTPTNPMAVSKGYSWINPGDPKSSFLLRKIHNNMYSDIVLDAAEGGVMPSATNALDPKEIDLINSWILHGAPINGSIPNEQLIENYYNGQGMVSMPRPPKPLPNEGIQIYLGALFLQPGEEVEYLKKYSIDIPYESEIGRIESFLNNFSHHLILYKYLDSISSTNYPYKLRLVNSFADFNSSTNYLATFQFSQDLQLPENTGYFWEKNPHLDLNYHIKNYSNDSILRAEMYTNIYFKPRQASTTEMKTALITYPETPLPFPFSNFLIPNNNTDVIYTGEVFGGTAGDSVYLWLLSSHTHKYGKDYDIYERNSDGTKATQLYEGFYNTNYTFNQGYYDYTHPPVRYFEPLHSLDYSKGIVHEAKFRNNGPSDVTWGLTTDDEMMLLMLQYTEERPIASSIKEPFTSSGEFIVYPNPAQKNVYIKAAQSIKNINVVDLSGRFIKCNIDQSSEFLVQMNLPEIASGVYFVRAVFENGQQCIRKLIIE